MNTIQILTAVSEVLLVVAPIFLVLGICLLFTMSRTNMGRRMAWAHIIISMAGIGLFGLVRIAMLAIGLGRS